MVNPELSILICHTAGREGAFGRLHRILRPQLARHQGVVEMLVMKDRGELTIGAKRNQLLQQAAGRYTVFIDDDDLVHQSYIDLILTEIQQAPEVDCVGIKGVITNGRDRRMNPRPFIHDLTIREWHEQGGVYYRPPNHLNPVLAIHSKTTEFPAIDFGEDKAWADALLPKLKTQRRIHEPIYFYLAA